MIPHMLRPTTHRDISVDLFGRKLEPPLLIAPVGLQTIIHTDKELGVAETATGIGVPYNFSTASRSSIEDVAKTSGDGVRILNCTGHKTRTLPYQYISQYLYTILFPRLTYSVQLLGHEKSFGYNVILVILDTRVLLQPNLETSYRQAMTGKLPHPAAPLTNRSNWSC